MNTKVYKKKYKTEEEVKKILDITDFRSLTKEKIMDFVSIIPKVEKEVAMSIINQFPNYADMSKEMVGRLLNSCEAALNNAATGRKEVIESYKIVLEALRDELKKEEITKEEKEEINKKMILIAEKIDNVNDKHNSLTKDIISMAGKTVAGALIIGAAVLGVNYKKK